MNKEDKEHPKKSVHFQMDDEVIKFNSTQMKSHKSKKEKKKESAKKGKSPTKPTSSTKAHQIGDSDEHAGPSKTQRSAAVRSKAGQAKHEGTGKGAATKVAHPKGKGGHHPGKGHQAKGKVRKSLTDTDKDSRLSSLCSHKDLLIEKSTKECYICTSQTGYYKGSFFCEECKTKFNNIVKTGDIINCIFGGKCNGKHACDFCIAETFYTHDIKATDVAGFFHIAHRYKISPEPTEKQFLSKEDKAFCKHYNKSFTTVLDWAWNQGDLLKLPPNDRLSVLEMNAGRARILWIAADMMPRHDVVKTVDSYLPISKFCSDIIRQTVTGINELAEYFRSLKFTPQHLYFVKLLAIFQIAKVPHPKCNCGEDNYEKVSEIKVLEENYRKILQLMKVSEDNLKCIKDHIDMMYCMNAIISNEDEIEDIDMKFSMWTAENPEWKSQQTFEAPSAIETYPKERLELCHYLNKICIPSLDQASECLNYFVSSRDKKELLCYNMMPVVVANICWTNEILTKYDEDSKVDKIVKMFYQFANEVFNIFHKDRNNSFINYFNFPDFMMICLSRPFSGSNIKLKDISIKTLHRNAKHAAIETAERQVKKKISSKTEQQKVFAHLQNNLETVIETIDKAAGILELSNKTLPLFLDVNSLIRG